MTAPVSQALQQLAAHPRCGALARLTRDSLFEAVGTNLDLSAGLAQRAASAGLQRDEANLESCNVFDALNSLSNPPPRPQDASTLGMLVAYALAQDPPQGVEAEDATALKLAWLAAHAGIDAFEAMDAALGERAAGLWGALADIVARHDKRGAGIGRADAIVAAAALISSEHPVAMKRRAELAASIETPTLAALLHDRQANDTPMPRDGSLAGELSSPPRGPIATFFMGLFGWLLVSHLARLVGRFALQYRRPAEVHITPEGIRVRSTTKLLGKVVRESETLIPVDGLARATREVRFPRVSTYVGLFALAIGSYEGVSWFIDGIRTASFSLATLGLLVFLAGVALDFALVSFLPGRKGRCRLVLVPRRGRATCVAWVDAMQADSLLQGLSAR